MSLLGSTLNLATTGVTLNLIGDIEAVGRSSGSYEASHSGTVGTHVKGVAELTMTEPFTVEAPLSADSRAAAAAVGTTQTMTLTEPTASAGATTQSGTGQISNAVPVFGGLNGRDIMRLTVEPLGAWS